jgi:hypothetical protein
MPDEQTWQIEFKVEEDGVEYRLIDASGRIYVESSWREEM